jgi:hypothetical protein
MRPLHRECLGGTCAPGERSRARPVGSPRRFRIVLGEPTDRGRDTGDSWSFGSGSLSGDERAPTLWQRQRCATSVTEPAQAGIPRRSHHLPMLAACDGAGTVAFAGSSMALTYFG